RFTGEVSSWPQRWEPSGSVVKTPIEASGIMRRLGQGAAPLDSTLYRSMVRETDNYPVAYWPCEDAQGSLSLASAVGGAPMTIVGKPNLASYSGFEAAAPIPTLAKDSWTGKVPAYSVTNKSQIRFIMHLPEV